MRILIQNHLKPSNLLRNKSLTCSQFDIKTDVFPGVPVLYGGRRKGNCPAFLQNIKWTRTTKTWEHADTNNNAKISRGAKSSGRFWTFSQRRRPKPRKASVGFRDCKCLGQEADWLLFPRDRSAGEGAKVLLLLKTFVYVCERVLYTSPLWSHSFLFFCYYYVRQRTLEDYATAHAKSLIRRSELRDAFCFFNLMLPKFKFSVRNVYIPYLASAVGI